MATQMSNNMSKQLKATARAFKKQSALKKKEAALERKRNAAFKKGIKDSVSNMKAYQRTRKASMKQIKKELRIAVFQKTKTKPKTKTKTLDAPVRRLSAPLTKELKTSVRTSKRETALKNMVNEFALNVLNTYSAKNLSKCRGIAGPPAEQVVATILERRTAMGKFTEMKQSGMSDKQLKKFVEGVVCNLIM